jgi:hypothetical protein
MTDAPDPAPKGNGDEAENAATRKLLEGLGAQVAQAKYNQVAPGFNPGAEPGKGRDPYYTGPADGKPQGAQYGPDGTLVPGGKPNNGNQGGEQVPSFTERHRDQQVDPSKPYARSDVGEQVRTGNQPQGQGRQFSWQGADFFDPRVQEAISMRGQHRDLFQSSIAAGISSIMVPPAHRFLTVKADEAVARAADTGVETRSSKLAKLWQATVDPSRNAASDLLKPSANSEAYKAFDSLTRDLAEKAKGTGDGAALAKEQLEYLNTRTAGGTIPKQALHDIAAATREGGEKLFDPAQLQKINARVDAGLLDDAAALKRSGRLAQLLEKSPSWMGRVGTGMLASAGQYFIVTTDLGMTQKTAGANGLHESWNASQILGPAALAALPGKFKLAAPIVAIGGSQAIDGVARLTGLTAPDRINAATGVYDGWNGASVAGSLTLATYAKDWRIKAGIATVGALAPMAMHALQDNVTGNLKGGVDSVKESFNYDHTKRTYGSLREVDSSMQKVLNKKEDWIVANVDASFAAMNDRWNKPAAAGGLTTEQKLLGLRDDASATGALSRNILDKGTRISDKGTEPQYMLDGYKLDVGGRALHYMLRTRNSADKAATLTEQIIRDNADPNKQVTIKGELPKQSEADDLRKYSAEAQTDITKILDGKHDIKGAFDELVKKAEVLDKEFLKTYIKGPDNLILYYNDKGAKAQAAAQRAAAEGNEPLRQEAELKTQEYAKVVAKLYRDQALAYMAMAAAKMKNGNDGGGAYDLLIDDGVNRKDIFPNGQKKGYNGAQGALRIADSYAPGNPDTQQLSEIFSQLAKEMQEKRKLQLTSSSSNVLGFRDQFSRPGQ